MEAVPNNLQIGPLSGKTYNMSGYNNDMNSSNTFMASDNFSEPPYNMTRYTSNMSSHHDTSMDFDYFPGQPSKMELFADASMVSTSIGGCSEDLDFFNTNFNSSPSNYDKMIGSTFPGDMNGVEFMSDHFWFNPDGSTAAFDGVNNTIGSNNTYAETTSASEKKTTRKRASKNISEIPTTPRATSRKTTTTSNFSSPQSATSATDVASSPERPKRKRAPKKVSESPAPSNVMPNVMTVDGGCPPHGIHNNGGLPSKFPIPANDGFSYTYTVPTNEGYSLPSCPVLTHDGNPFGYPSAANDMYPSPSSLPTSPSSIASNNKIIESPVSPTENLKKKRTSKKASTSSIDMPYDMLANSGHAALYRMPENGGYSSPDQIPRYTSLYSMPVTKNVVVAPQSLVQSSSFQGLQANVQSSSAHSPSPSIHGIHINGQSLSPHSSNPSFYNSQASIQNVSVPFKKRNLLYSLAVPATEILDFKLFPKVVREMIWKLSLPESRIFEVSFDRKVPFNQYSAIQQQGQRICTHDQKLPGVFLACKESRRVAMKTNVTIGPKFMTTSITFNPRSDVIFFANFSILTACMKYDLTEWKKYGIQKFAVDPTFHKTLGSLQPMISAMAPQDQNQVATVMHGGPDGYMTNLGKFSTHLGKSLEIIILFSETEMNNFDYSTELLRYFQETKARYDHLSLAFSGDFGMDPFLIPAVVSSIYRPKVVSQNEAPTSPIARAELQDGLSKPFVPYALRHGNTKPKETPATQSSGRQIFTDSEMALARGLIRANIVESDIPKVAEALKSSNGAADFWDTVYSVAAFGKPCGERLCLEDIEDATKLRDGLVTVQDILMAQIFQKEGLTGDGVYLATELHKLGFHKRDVTCLIKLRDEYKDYGANDLRFAMQLRRQSVSKEEVVKILEFFKEGFKKTDIRVIQHVEKKLKGTTGVSFWNFAHAIAGGKPSPEHGVTEEHIAKAKKVVQLGLSDDNLAKLQKIVQLGLTDDALAKAQKILRDGITDEHIDKAQRILRDGLSDDDLDNAKELHQAQVTGDDIANAQEFKRVGAREKDIEMALQIHQSGFTQEELSLAQYLHESGFDSQRFSALKDYLKVIRNLHFNSFTEFAASYTTGTVYLEHAFKLAASNPFPPGQGYFGREDADSPDSSEQANEVDEEVDEDEDSEGAAESEQDENEADGNYEDERVDSFIDAVVDWTGPDAPEQGPTEAETSGDETDESEEP